jgi:hypothetical protein
MLDGPCARFIIIIIKLSRVRATSRVRWVPCQHGMARPQVADGRDALQPWRADANIYNKQSRTAGKGWSSSLGLGVGLTTLHRKKIRLLQK